MSHTLPSWPVTLGIVPELDPNAGGIYQYGLCCLEALRARRDQGAGIVVLARDPDCGQARALAADGWRVLPLYPPGTGTAMRGRARSFLFGSALAAPLRLLWRRWRILRRRRAMDAVQVDRGLESWLRGQGVGMLLLPAPMRTGFESGLPYVMAVHDLQHRLQPRFPEVSAGGEWEEREYLFRNGCRHAAAVLADSEVGREDVVNCYGEWGVGADRVAVLPFLPAPYIGEVPPEARAEVRARYGLPARYFFYPAQFWPHKNHAALVEAVRLLAEGGRDVALVLSGSHSGALRTRVHAELRAAAERGGVSGRILTLGYLPNDDMAAIYSEAVALVMPTFFGPTNIPVLEAWALGCPVVTSDIRGIREQMGDAALLADPTSPPAIAEGWPRLWDDEALRADLAARGRARLATYTAEDFRSRLLAVLDRTMAQGAL